MPKVTEEHRVARKHQIARAALRCFARNGFAATSMADIIAESGLSAGAIYGHYKSKDELIALAVSEILDARFLEVAEIRAQDPLPAPGEVVRTLVTGILTQIGEVQLLIQVWGQVPINPELRTMAAAVGGRVRTMFADYLTQWFGRDRSPAEARALGERYCSLYVGIVQGFMTQTVLFEDFDGDAYLDAVSAIHLAG
ncbi:TetR/AcrR family transcriptional regulator [Leifsonia sp. NPDC080035]|uniref:TetR/AcrR family transcriptional regulator n=1 Tax=Leifsonia sp. NPDC080035 TaxID=3143936 RepID=A0AAU7GB24_9MICO